MAAIFDALGTLLTPMHLFYLTLGVTVGFVVGILPGLGGIVGLTLLLPFVFGLEPTAALAMMLGVATVTNSSDAFPAILLGVPGSSSSSASIMDGYPLSRQGQAARALGAAFSASLLGGLFGAVLLAGLILIARPFVLAFGSPQLFMLCLFSLAMVGVLSRASPMAGLAAGCLGLLVGAIGGAAGASEYRYTFGMLYLREGIPLAVMALGLFAIPELLAMAAKKEGVAQGRELTGSLFQGIRDTLQNIRLVIQTSTLGVTLGMLPGVGGTAIDWITYGLSQRVSKNGKFGRGDVRGVIGPEASGNAKDGGAMLPTLIFGIPGSGSTAILLGGLISVGITPGPRLAIDSPEIIALIVWSMALANIIGTIFCLVSSRFIARLTTVRGEVLIPFILLIVVVGAYQTRGRWEDLMFLVFFGIVGYIMRANRIPRPPFLIAFVLAHNIERYLHLSIGVYGARWLLFPSVVAIATLTLLVVFSATARGQLLRRSLQSKIWPSAKAEVNQ